jgi:hypothetical protein
MAQRVLLVNYDDFDGSEGANPVLFGLDGVEYLVDLNAEHEQQLRDFLQAFINVGRKPTKEQRRGALKSTTKSSGGSGEKSSKASKQENELVRAWARENGYEISDRGRISEEIREAYKKSMESAVEESVGAMTGVVPPPPPADPVPMPEAGSEPEPASV